MKKILTILSLLCSIIIYAQDPYNFDGEVILKNYEGINFKNSSNNLDGTQIIRYTGNALRVRFTHQLIFDALNNYGVYIKNSNDQSTILLHPSGNSYFLNGHFGIGISEPTSKLHISGALSNILRVQNTTGGQGSDVGIDFCTFRGTTEKNARIATIDEGLHNGALAFYTDGDGTKNANVVERMRIDHFGNVGIGTQSPSGSRFVVVPSSDQGIALSTHRSSTNNSRLDFTHYTIQRTDVNGNPNDILINPNGGDIGIGTWSPDATLTVDGNIHAEEVKVDLNVPGPDYVFEEVYNLRSLEDTKAYITENKHLPEIPSAKIMEEEGINLSDMNMLLLKKIEELTLYVIKEHETNELLLDKITLLEKEITTLKTK